MSNLIHSKVEPEKLLHIINRKDEIVDMRHNISPESAYLQVAGMNIPSNHKYKAHKHLPLKRQTDITQESWVVISGFVKVWLYDIDDTLLHETTLSPGDCSVTLEGGHTYKALVPDTVVYEFKTGPYYGIEKDKVFLNE